MRKGRTYQLTYMLTKLDIYSTIFKAQFFKPTCTPRVDLMFYSCPLNAIFWQSP
ncbi:hypothetical protein HanIR_Chr14g0723721 [Helianthus annuus]|nr:hypothetical protein HanIR_Chr14g0723721 [Helianthus annuus]